MKEKCFINCEQVFQEIKLSSADVVCTSVPVSRGLVFDYVIDIDLLKSSLKEILKVFPILTGRLKKIAEGTYHIEASDKGLLFEHVSNTGVVPRFNYGSPLSGMIKSYCSSLTFSPADKDVPLVGIRVNTFQDATIITLSNCHFLMDGSAAWFFMQSWANYVRGGSLPSEVNFDRAPLIFNFGQTPLEKSKYIRDIELSILGAIKFYAKCILSPLWTKQVAIHLRASDLAHQKKLLQENLPEGVWVSTQDVAMATISNLVSQASEKKSLLATTVYNIRLFQEMKLPQNYFGNAAASRCFKIEKNIADPVAKIATSIRSLKSTVTKESVMNELANWQELQRVKRKGILLPMVVIEQFDDGLLLNNYSRFPMYDVDFGNGHAIWADYPRSLLGRTVTFCPDPNNDGVCAHVCLPKKEMKIFLSMIEEM